MKRHYTFLIALVAFPFFLSAQTDEPCAAAELAVSASCSGIVKTAGSVNLTTFTNSTDASSGVTLPALSCNGFTTTTRDFWYKVTVPASGKVIVTMEAGTGASPTDFWDMAIYSASSSTCAGATFTELGSSCVAQTPPSVSVTGQTVGATLYVRVWREAVSSQTVTRTYDIFAVDGGIQGPTTGGTYILPASGATGQDELIFVFEVPANTTQYQFYIGPTAATAISLGTIDIVPPKVRDTLVIPYAYLDVATLTNIVTPNAVNSWFVVPGNCAAFAPLATCQATASSFTAASAPTNNECAGAIMLDPDSPEYGVSTFSTQSRAPLACSGFTSDYAADTWFKFSTNAVGGTATVLAQSYGFTDVIVEAFSGTCAGLTSLGCVDDVGTADFEELVLTGLLPNTTYYVRVYGYVADGDFFWPDGFDIEVTGTGVAIPVELIHFSGEKRDKSNVLKWSTASEREAQDFVIEHSKTGLDNSFSPIGSVKSAGFSQTLKNYSFTDDAPTAFAYYRLRQRDLNGRETFSKIVALHRSEKFLTIQKTFPIPMQNDLTVQFNQPRNGLVSFDVFDILGRIVFQKKAYFTEGVHSARLDAPTLSAGAYILQLNDGVQTAQLRILKQ